MSMCIYMHIYATVSVSRIIWSRTVGRLLDEEFVFGWK
jgi:hypothetical protein